MSKYSINVRVINKRVFGFFRVFEKYGLLNLKHLSDNNLIEDLKEDY